MFWVVKVVWLCFVLFSVSLLPAHDWVWHNPKPCSARGAASIYQYGVSCTVGSLFRGACAIWQGFDPCSMFPHGRFRQSAQKCYVNYVPSPVRRIDHLFQNTPYFENSVCVPQTAVYLYVTPSHFVVMSSTVRATTFLLTSIYLILILVLNSYTTVTNIPTRNNSC